MSTGTGTNIYIYINLNIPLWLAKGNPAAKLHSSDGGYAAGCVPLRRVPSMSQRALYSWCSAAKGETLEQTLGINLELLKFVKRNYSLSVKVVGSDFRLRASMEATDPVDVQNGPEKDLPQWGQQN